MKAETLKFNQSIVLSLMETLEHWEAWINRVPHGTTKLLNQQLLRLSKGLVKAYRTFLIELQQNQQPLESDSSRVVMNSPPPSVQPNRGSESWQKKA